MSGGGNRAAGGDFVGENDSYSKELLAVQRRLYIHILTLLPNLVDAADVLQETNAVLLQKKDEFRPGTNFGAWACQIAYFQVLAYRKRQRRDRHLFGGTELLERMAPEVTGRVLESNQDQALARLQECMSEVSGRDREMLDLRYRVELSSEAIGDRLGRTATAVRRQLWRIRVNLLQCLERKLQETKHD